MDFTSRHGQPVNAERDGVLAAGAAPSLVKTMVRDGIVGTAEPLCHGQRLLHL
jgi:hypothetical protein